jgi:hypothetical protein
VELVAGAEFSVWTAGASERDQSGVNEGGDSPDGCVLGDAEFGGYAAYTDGSGPAVAVGPGAEGELLEDAPGLSS